MRKRQVVIFTLMSLLCASIVYAQRRPLIGLPDIFTKAIKFLFVDIMNLSATGAGVAYMKMFLWLILSIFVYLGLNKAGLFGNRQGLLGTVSALIALIGTIFIPSKLVISIFSIHSSLVAITAGLAPVGLGFWINHRQLTGTNTFHRIFRAVIYFAMAAVTYALLVVIAEI